MEAMKSLDPKYPDGAVFAKVALQTENDPAFTSSKIPGTVSRYQIMVKDHKKYADSDGWGYALFNSDGFLFDENPKSTTQGCVACHRIVPQRQYVFSRPANLNPASGLAGHKDASPLGFTFKEIAASQEHKAIFKELPETIKSAEFLQGDLKSMAFSGTLDEIVPTLLDHAKAARRPAFLSVNETNFSGVIPQPGAAHCLADKQPYRILVVYNSKRVRDAEVCY
jgi:hypothetical protein